MNEQPQKQKGKLVTIDKIKDKITEYRNDGGPTKGLTTGWHNLDEYYNVSKGTLTVVTGIPSSGKSEFMDQLMLQTVARHNWSWCIFSPENWPLPYHFQKLCEKWVGKSMFYGKFGERITEIDIEDTIDILNNSLVFIDPPENDITVQSVTDLLHQGVDEYATDAFLLDPWNELEHTRPSSMSETEHIGQALTKLRKFGRKHDVAIYIVAHPTKMKKQDDGNYPVPTAYDVSGSSHWYNKCDACITIWRDYNLDDDIVDVHIKKVRNKNIGKLGQVKLYWCRENGLFFCDQEFLYDKEHHGIRQTLK